MNSNRDNDENRFKMAAILKSKMVVSGNDYCMIIFFITMFIIQFPSTFFYVGLSSLYLKVAKNA